MAAINDLIARIKDPELRMRIEKEVKDLKEQKDFGAGTEMRGLVPVQMVYRGILQAAEEERVCNRGHSTGKHTIS